MTKTVCFVFIFMLAACSSSPKKETPPALTPGGAASLLHYNAKAETWLNHVKKTDTSCEYRLDLPDQFNHPTTIDLDHIVYCGNKPSPREFDAAVSFAYDKDKQQWVITRFAS